MTIYEALAGADLSRPNELEPALKLHWLSQLDGQIWQDVLQAHEGGPAGEFPGYDGSTDITTTRLLVPAPADELYLRYLEMRIDLEQGELTQYNNSARLFQAALHTWASRHTRTHRPLGPAALRF